MEKTNKLKLAILLTLSTLTLYSCARYSSVTVIGGKKEFHFKVEIARTQEEREKGLMFRDSLKHNRGMLFIFEEPRILSFWMKNTYVPLTILFIDENYTITDIYDMYPLVGKIYPSTKPCKYALEINQKLINDEVKIGDKVNFVL